MTGELQPLNSLTKGERGIVHHLNGGRMIRDRLLVMGFTTGAEVKIIQNPGFGPVIIYVRDSRIAMGRGEANKVIVTKLA